MLAAEGITVAFDGFRAVEEAAIEVPAGGMVGLVGPNGAGKSTLFGAITGFLRAQSGRVVLDGVDITRMPAHRRVRAGLARTFQVPREFTHLSVRENLAAAVPDQAGEGWTGLFLRPGRVAADATRVRGLVEDALQTVGLAHVAELGAGRLSGGQRKLLELGRALLTAPKLVLLDEPFAGVNPVMIDRLSETVRALNERGIAFLIVEHNLSALSRLVGGLTVMDRGRVIASGRPAEVLALPAVQDAYLGVAA